MRRRPAKSTGAREYLIGEYERLIGMYAGMVATSPTCPWPAELAALRAGRPLVVGAWQVAEFLPLVLWRYERDVAHHVRVEPDGSITPVAVGGHPDPAGR